MKYSVLYLCRYNSFVHKEIVVLDHGNSVPLIVKHCTISIFVLSSCGLTKM